MSNTKATTVAPEREVSGKVVNPRSIEFPYDKYGFTTLLRKEGVRAVGRIKGDETKLRVLMQTLKVLAQHAETKIADQVKDAEQSAAAAKNREQAEYARSLADQEREVSRLEVLLESAKAAVAERKAAPVTPGSASTDD